MERAAALWKEKQKGNVYPDETRSMTYEDYDDYIDRMTELSNITSSDIVGSDVNGVQLKPPVHKPFTEIVKLQRPEITRQKELNKPKTYQEQLSEINKIQTEYKHHPGSNRTPRTQLSPGGALRSARRGDRPKPYDLLERDEDDSEISEWVVPSQILNFIYGSDYEQHSSFAGQSFEEGSDLSKLSDLYDATSVHSGSYIDWDQVDRIVGVDCES